MAADLSKKIKVTFDSNRRGGPAVCEVTIAQAIDIARAEIFEHAGGADSAAYAFTNAVFRALAIEA